MRHNTSVLFAMALSLTGTITTFAQSDAPRIRSIIRYTIKPERAADMAAAIKEYNEVLSKAQYDKGYTIWRSVTGPTEMLLVSNHNSFAELDVTRAADPKLKDHAAQMSAITRRINDSFSSVQREIDIVNWNMSLPRAPEPPPMIMVWTAHVKQGKLNEALALEKDEYLPAVKAAGLKTYVFAQVRFGGPSNEIHATVGLSNWADIDEANPIRKAMGDEKYRAFSTKMNDLLEDYTYNIYRLDKALSYAPAK